MKLPTRIPGGPLAGTDVAAKDSGVRYVSGGESACAFGPEAAHPATRHTPDNRRAARLRIQPRCFCRCGTRRAHWVLASRAYLHKRQVLSRRLVGPARLGD